MTWLAAYNENDSKIILSASTPYITIASYVCIAPSSQPCFAKAGTPIMLLVTCEVKYPAPNPQTSTLWIQGDKQEN